MLYHLFKHHDHVVHLGRVQDFLRKAGLGEMPSARVVAFVGIHADAQEGRTPWGEIAAQFDRRNLDKRLKDAESISLPTTTPAPAGAS